MEQLAPARPIRPSRGDLRATPTGDPVLSAKLHVATVRPRVLVRRRLLDRLSAGTRGPLTLVSAPAGAGKTVLVSSWASAGAVPGPVAWITLDEGDDQPGVFWAYVLEALVRGGVELPGVGAPVRSDAVDRSLLVRLAACISDRPEPVVLVLDRAEQLAGHAVCDDLDFLLAHAAPQLRVVMLTRADPPLPLHRYRVAGSMTEIRLRDLAFTVAEARALLSEHDVQLSGPALGALTERTKGWAAALRIVAMSLQGQPDPDTVVRWLAGDEGEIAEYLLAEVLDAQPATTRDFLLVTSVADRLWPGLAEALSGRPDAARLLAGLAHQNTFIEVTLDPKECFEYHPLFRDLLRAQLAGAHPHRVDELHRTAALWLADADQPAAAARHAIAAGDWAAGAQVVVGALAIGRLIVGPEVDRFAEVFAGLPDDTPGPEPAVVRAAQAMVRFDLATCAQQLARAKRIAGNRCGPPARPLWLSIAVVELLLARASGDVNTALLAAATAGSVLADISGAGGRVPPEVPALVLSNKGTMLLWAGRLEAAADALAAGARVGDAPRCRYSLLNCLGQLALIEVLRGRLRRATALATSAEQLADRYGLSLEHRPPAADVALAWVHTEEYDLAVADHHAHRAAATAAINHDPVPAAALALVRCRLARVQGDIDGAARLIGAARALATGTPMPVWLDRRLGAVESTLPKGGDLPSWTGRPAGTDGSADGPVAAGEPVPMVESLTEKELEVLRHLAELLSTEEIASAMFVSVNTVKTHVRGILRKLSVSRRNGAIRRARQLGLI